MNFALTVALVATAANAASLEWADFGGQPSVPDFAHNYQQHGSFGGAPQDPSGAAGSAWNKFGGKDSSFGSDFGSNWAGQSDRQPQQHQHQQHQDPWTQHQHQQPEQ